MNGSRLADSNQRSRLKGRSDELRRLGYDWTAEDERALARYFEELDSERAALADSNWCYRP